MLSEAGHFHGALSLSVHGSCFVLGVLFLLLVPALVSAQGIIGQPVQVVTGLGSTVQGFLPSLWQNPLADLDLDTLSVNTQVRAGIKTVSATINIQIPTGGINIFPIDFQVRDAPLWVGSLNCEVFTGGRVSFFMNGEGNVVRNMAVVSSQQPFPAAFTRVDWTGHRWEWWAVDGGMKVGLWDGASVVGGLLYDHLNLHVNDPRSPQGPITPVVNIYEYAGDILAKTWIPYAGIEISGDYFKARLIGSPFAGTRIRFPIRFSGDFSGFFDTYNDLRYGLDRGGLYFAGDFQCRVYLLPSLGLDLWASASWLRIKGLGTEVTDANAVFPGGVIVPIAALSESGLGFFSLLSLSGGLSATHSF